MNKKTAPILIVEDTVEIGEVIQATLEGMGLESVHEAHGKSGLDRMKAIDPHLILLTRQAERIAGGC